MTAIGDPILDPPPSSRPGGELVAGAGRIV
jgi:hypothetical protein